jgi:hypothetical protein
LREDWITDNTVDEERDHLPSVDDVIDYNAESLKGEAV